MPKSNFFGYIELKAMRLIHEEISILQTIQRLEKYKKLNENLIDKNN